MLAAESWFTSLTVIGASDFYIGDMSSSCSLFLDFESFLLRFYTDILRVSVVWTSVLSAPDSFRGYCLAVFSSSSAGRGLFSLLMLFGDLKEMSDLGEWPADLSEWLLENCFPLTIPLDLIEILGAALLLELRAGDASG